MPHRCVQPQVALAALGSVGGPIRKPCALEAALPLFPESMHLEALLPSAPPGRDAGSKNVCENSAWILLVAPSLTSALQFSPPSGLQSGDNVTALPPGNLSGNAWEMHLQTPAASSHHYQPLSRAGGTQGPGSIPTIYSHLT